MLLDDIATILKTAGTTSDGTEVYTGFMPEKPDAVACIYETGGVAPYRSMRGTVGAVVAERPRIQVTVRGSALDYATPRTKLNTIYKMLENYGDTTVNGVRYLWIAAVQSPFPIRRDDNTRVIVGMNFDVVKELS
jgi:hypothetical protein